MNQEQQTWTALGVVALTGILLAIRWWRARKKPGCGGCGCDKMKPR